MQFIVLVDDRNAFLLKSRDKKNEEYTIEKVDLFNNSFPGTPCLIIDKEERFIALREFPINTPETELEEIGLTIFNINSKANIMIKQTPISADRKLVFFSRKSDIIQFFKHYMFSSIIPLDYILYKMGSSLTGLFGEDISYTRKFDDNPFENIQNKLFYSNNSSNLKIVLNKVKKEDVKLHAYIDSRIYNELINEEGSKDYLIAHKLSEIDRIIKSEEDIIIHDRYSINFQSKRYKNILLFSSIAMIILASFLFYTYANDRISYTLAKNRLSKLEEEKRFLDSQISSIKNEIIYTKYVKFNVDPLYRFLQNRLNNIEDFTISIDGIYNDKGDLKSKISIVLSAEDSEKLLKELKKIGVKNIEIRRSSRGKFMLSFQHTFKGQKYE